MLGAFRSALATPDLRRKILFTLLIISVYRLGSFLPLPNVNVDVLAGQTQDAQQGFLSFINLFSGGALTRLSVFALGIMPYITASIIMQLLTVVIPTLERLQKEGESGYAKINQYTRYFTVALSAAQAIGYSYLFKRQGALGTDVGLSDIILIVVTLAAGATLLMRPAFDPADALRDLAEQPATLLGLKDLTATIKIAAPLVEFVAPYQTVCNYWVYYWNAISEHVSEPVRNGTIQRALSKSDNRTQDNRVSDMSADIPADIPEDQSVHSARDPEGNLWSFGTYPGEPRRDA